MNRSEMVEFFALAKEADEEDRTLVRMRLIQETFMEIQWDLQERISELKMILSIEDPDSSNGMKAFEGLDRVRAYYTKQLERCTKMSQQLTATYDDTFFTSTTEEEQGSFCEALLDVRDYLDRLWLYLHQEQKLAFAALAVQEHGAESNVEEVAVVKTWKQVIMIEESYRPEMIRLALCRVLTDPTITVQIRNYLQQLLFEPSSPPRIYHNPLRYPEALLSDRWERIKRHQRVKYGIDRREIHV